MYNGVINVYKESGFTSFDVVAKLRGILKQKKIGHTGTLDPDAQGVLVVCLGVATKLCDILTDKDKSYEATLLLGKTTDTEDSSGTILSEHDVDLTEEEVKTVILSFIGEYDQIPPMYSAIKVDGKKLYEFARKGIEIERKPRRVQIYNIDIIDMNLPYVTFRVSCGKGTYIRSLCRDIGNQLGCGGIMEKLVRNSVNATDIGKKFTKEDALTLHQIEDLVELNHLNEYIVPIEDLFPEFPKYYTKAEADKKLYNGNLLKKDDFLNEIPEDLVQNQALIYDSKDNFLALYRYIKEESVWKADKMFII